MHSLYWQRFFVCVSPSKIIDKKEKKTQAIKLNGYLFILLFITTLRTLFKYKIKKRRKKNGEKKANKRRVFYLMQIP